MCYLWYYFWAARQEKQGRRLQEYIHSVGGRYVADEDKDTLLLSGVATSVASAASAGKWRSPAPRGRATQKEVMMKLSNTPGCAVFEEIGRSGTNSPIDIKTCRKCGEVTAWKKTQEPLIDPSTGKYFDPENCPHDVMNFRGVAHLRRTRRIAGHISLTHGPHGITSGAMEPSLYFWRTRTLPARMVHLISFGSTVVKRAAGSTIKAEAYQLTDVVEAADLAWAAIAVDHKKGEETSAAWTNGVWFIDCWSSLQNARLEDGGQEVGNRLRAAATSPLAGQGRTPPGQTVSRREAERAYHCHG